MSGTTESDVRRFVLARVAPSLERLGVDAATVSDDFDLLAEGVIDSFGFLELIGALEESLGVEVDFGDVDPDELTTVGAFSRHVHAQAVPIPSDREAEEPTEAAGPVRTTPSAPTPLAGLPSGAFRKALGRTVANGHRLWVRGRDRVFSLLVAGSFHSFGSHSVIQLPVRLVNEHRIAVGSDVFVAAAAWLQVLDSDSDEVAIEIGDGASIAGGCVLSAASSIRLGTDVSLARNVYIADHTHRYDDVTRPILAQGITQVESVEIGDGAWLGENAIVFPGVRIGRGAVVSANSVVNGDVPDYSVVAGQPARVVRRFGPTNRKEP